LNIYLSKKPKKYGGGSNSFISLFNKWAKKSPHKIVNNPKKADLAIIIAHFAEEHEVKALKERGCYLIHRLDEYFDKNENPNRLIKHKKIIQLNRYMDITVFQSRFVYANVSPILKPHKYKIIHNGGDPDFFSPGKKFGEYIGHVSWSVGKRKRLDLLYDFIKNHPHEKFLLVGRHQESIFNFCLPNVKMIGKVNREKISKYFRKMKMLYFPSENDPCPNTVIESILCGVPVCYNPLGGSIEIVNGPLLSEYELKVPVKADFEINRPETIFCGLPLSKVDTMLNDLEPYKQNCLKRNDLYFDRVFKAYLSDLT